MEINNSTCPYEYFTKMVDIYCFQDNTLTSSYLSALTCFLCFILAFVIFRYSSKTIQNITQPKSKDDTDETFCVISLYIISATKIMLAFAMMQ